MFELMYNFTINTKGDVCMENIKMELIELIKKIDDEKILNRIKFVVLGARNNKKELK